MIYTSVLENYELDNQINSLMNDIIEESNIVLEDSDGKSIIDRIKEIIVKIKRFIKDIFDKSVAKAKLAIKVIDNTLKTTKFVHESANNKIEVKFPIITISQKDDVNATSKDYLYKRYNIGKSYRICGNGENDVVIESLKNIMEDIKDIFNDKFDSANTKVESDHGLFIKSVELKTEEKNFMVNDTIGIKNILINLKNKEEELIKFVSEYNKLSDTIDMSENIHRLNNEDEKSKMLSMVTKLQPVVSHSLKLLYSYLNRTTEFAFRISHLCKSEFGTID